MPRKARDCTRCVHFRGFHPKYPDSFGCGMDPYCSWMEYKKKKVCFYYEQEEGK